MDEPLAAGGAGRGPVGLTLSIDEGGLAWVEIRSTRGAAVPVPLEALLELDEHIEMVEALAGAGEVRLLLLRCAPPFPSLSGYDLDELLGLSEDELGLWSREAQRVLRRLELLPVPSIAAIQGEWLGGAAELALACSYRVASDAPGTAIGFPQVLLGCIPAWGGTVRLPRLVGLQTSYQIILSGEPLTGEEAEGAGLIDRILPADEFGRNLVAYAERRLKFGRPRERRKRPIRRRLLDDTAPGRRLLATRAGRLHLPASGPSIAARAALDLIRETVALPLDAAFATEAAAAGRLILSSDAQGRLHSQRFAERARLRSPLGPGDFDAAAVLGAGQTGSDIAHLLASGDLQVSIKDVRRELVRQGVAVAHDRLAWERGRGRITAGQEKRRASRMRGVTGFGGFGTLDLVVAVPDAAGRGAEELLLEVEPHVRPAAMLAFHDWTVSPTRVQRALDHPERVIALAPGLPLERFPILEIVPGALSSPEVVSFARRLAGRLGVTGIVVSDETPTPGTRLLGAYLAEGARLLDEGATVEQIDAAAEGFGFEAGPMYRIDAIGSRRAYRMLTALAERLGERMRPSPLFERVALSAETLFRYRDGLQTGPGPSLPPGASPGGDAVEELILRRIVLMLINEAALIVEEGGVSDTGDLEMIALLGLGFPRSRGGILFHAQSLDLTAIVEDMVEHSLRHGERFAPAGLLRDLASSGRGFFSSDRRRQPPGGSG